MNTGQRNTQGRAIFRGPRGGEYVIGPGGKKIRSFKRVSEAAAPSAPASSPPHKKVAKMMRIGNKWISKSGTIYRKSGEVHTYGLSGQFKHVINTRREAYTRDPKYLYKSVVPFLRRENRNAGTKLKLTKAPYSLHPNNEPNLLAQVFYNKNGHLYYVTMNNRKVKVTNASWPFRIYNMSVYRRTQRTIGTLDNRYPRSAIPPVTPPREREARSSPVLVNNMMNQIYEGGRGSNINATRYTPTEREILIRRLSRSIQYFKERRDEKKTEAAHERKKASNRRIAVSTREKRLKAASAANERVGYYDDAVRAYTRGLRALKPLTGNVPASVRRMRATPNRSTPAPASEDFNAIYMPLEKPHLVVKTPGVGAIYLNPNSFRGLVKNAARVNIPEANVRDWLRMARRNFPNEPLFRHPIATSKNVTASHIRFSR